MWVSWQFLKSGWLKVSSWDVTLELFRSEYHVPLLPPYLAAVVGAFGELFFPMLLILGLFTRLGALGLFAVNAMAVISYWHVLVRRLRGSARTAHLVGLHDAVLAMCGGGSISLDKPAGTALRATLPPDDAHRRHE